MLPPEVLDTLPDAFVALWREVEDSILRDAARRIGKMDALTETANWQLWRYQQTEAVRNNVVKLLARYSGKSERTIRSLLKEAATEAMEREDAIYYHYGLEPTPFEESATLNNLLDAGSRQTNGTWQNLTATTANTVTGAFERTLDAAWGKVSTGAFDYKTAVKQAVDSLADDLPVVTYPSGHTDTLEVAARRAVLTGVNQTAGKLQLARMDEMGAEFVETSAHGGARPSHAEWQGRRFHRGGPVDYNGRHYPDFEETTGYGTGAGLCGWNCRHSFWPCYPDLGDPPTWTGESLRQLNARDIEYNGKLYTRYEITQMQRALERRVRKYKRRYLAETAAGVDASQSAAKLKAARQQLSAFLAETGERVDGARTEVPGFGQREAKQADAASSALQSAQNNATLKEISLGYKEITIQSIQHIQPFACETLDAAGSRALANAHKKLLLEARKVPLGTEKARCYGLDMQPLSKIIISGQQGRVRIPDQDVPYIAAHTHPSGLTFSPSDIRRFALRENMRMLTAVGNDGTVYAIEKTAPFDRSGLLALFRDSEIRLAAAKDPKELQEIMQQLLKEAKQYGANFYAGRDR